MNEKKQVFNMYKTQKAKEEKVHNTLACFSYDQSTQNLCYFITIASVYKILGSNEKYFAHNFAYECACV